MLLAGVLFAAGLAYLLIEASVRSSHSRPFFQAWLLAVAGVYFCWHWIRGQTLPMKTWRIRLVGRNGAPVSVQRATLRYMAAVLGSIPFGITFLWAFADPERHFLHDRLAGTRLIDAS